MRIPMPTFNLNYTRAEVASFASRHLLPDSNNAKRELWGDSGGEVNLKFCGLTYNQPWTVVLCPGYATLFHSFSSPMSYISFSRMQTLLCCGHVC